MASIVGASSPSGPPPKRWKEYDEMASFTGMVRGSFARFATGRAGAWGISARWYASPPGLATPGGSAGPAPPTGPALRVVGRVDDHQRTVAVGRSEPVAAEPRAGEFPGRG